VVCGMVAYRLER